MATGTLLTIDDFELLPAEAAENHELVEGELVDVSGNTPRHNELRDWLIALMLPWMKERGLGTAIAGQEFDFLGNAHGPDVSVLGPAKAALLDLDRRVQRFVPDLAIEVASPSDTYEGLLAKKDRYLKSGDGRGLAIFAAHARTRDLWRATQLDPAGHERDHHGVDAGIFDHGRGVAARLVVRSPCKIISWTGSRESVLSLPAGPAGSASKPPASF